MMLSLMLMFVADPGLQQVVVEGRAQSTHIDLRFGGRPTFQAFQSESEGLLVVDVVGGQRPAGFPEVIALFNGATLKLVEHVGSRTRLLRLELHTGKGTPSSAQALRGGIRLEIRKGSKGLRVFQASGSRLASPEGPASNDVKAPHKGPDSTTLKTALAREREETSRLRQLLGNFRRHSGERADELRALDEKSSEGKARSQRNGKKLKVAGRALSQLEKKIRLRRQEIVKLEAAESAAKQRLTQVKGSSRDRTAELSRLELVEMAHRAEITRLVREEMELENGDTAYLARMARLQLSINRLAKKQKTLSVKAAKKQAALKTRETEAKALKAEQARYQRRIGDLEQRFGAVKKGVSSQDQKLIQLRSKLDKLDGELGLALGRYEAAEKRLKKSQAAEANFQNQAVDLRSRIAKLVRDTADRQAQHGQSVRRLGRDRSRVKKLTSSVEKARQEAQRAGILLSRVRKDVDVNERRAVGLNKELSRLKALSASAARGLADAKRALKDKDSDLRGLEKRLSKRREQLSLATSRAQKAKVALARNGKERRRLNKELKETRKRFDQRSASVERLQKQLRKNQVELEQIKSSVTALKGRELDLGEPEGRAREALGRSRKRYAASQAQIRVRQREVDALVRARKKTEAEAAQASQKAKRLNALAKAEQVRILKAKTAAKADSRPQIRPAKAGKQASKPAGRYQGSEAPSGFGGERGKRVTSRAVQRPERRESKSNVKRVGYRPVGPERVVIHVDGKLRGNLKRVSRTTTIFEIPGARSAKTNASLNTKRFGGQIHRISSRLKQGRMRVRITHEPGLRLKSVKKKGRLEVRVR